jgi:hypothetical protein
VHPAYHNSAARPQGCSEEGSAPAPLAASPSRAGQEGRSTPGVPTFPIHACRLSALHWRERLEEIARRQVPPRDELAVLSSGLIGLRADGTLVIVFGNDPALILDATSLRLLPRFARRRAALTRRLRDVPARSERASISRELKIVCCLVKLLEYFYELDDGCARRSFSGRSRNAIAEAAARLRPSRLPLARPVR